MFEVICKKSHFSNQCINWYLKFCLVLHVRPTETWNQDPKLLPNLFSYHESNDDLRISKQAFVENWIFYVSSIISIYVKFQQLSIRGLFWKTSIPFDSYWQVGFNFELKSLVWLMGGKLAFWMILPLGSKMWNCNFRAAVNERRAWLGSYKRYELNTQLVTGFSGVLIFIWFYEKRYNLNRWFLK